VPFQDDSHRCGFGQLALFGNYSLRKATTSRVRSPRLSRYADTSGREIFSDVGIRSPVTPCRQNSWRVSASLSAKNGDQGSARFCDTGAMSERGGLDPLREAFQILPFDAHARPFSTELGADGFIEPGSGGILPKHQPPDLQTTCANRNLRKFGH
jgi:hypothetical protein